MPPIRGSEFSKFSGSSAFIDNLLQGENIRRARQEAELNQQVLQSQLANADIARRTAEYNLGRAPIDDAFTDKQRQIQLFNLEELLRNSVAQGTMPSEGGGFGEITDVSRALPGIPAPMREISYGDMTAKGPFGEFTVSQEEGKKRRSAQKKQLEITAQESIAKQAGTLQSNAQAHQNRLAEAQYKDYLERRYQKEIVEPRELEKQKKLFEHELAVERIRADSRRKIANTGTAAQAEEFYYGTLNGSISMAQIPAAIRNDVLALHRMNNTVVTDNKKATGLHDILRNSQDLIAGMERASMTFDEEGALGNFLKTGGFMMDTGLPFTDVRAEVGKMTESAIRLARTATKDRVSNQDAFAFEVGSMPAPTDSPEIRARKIQDAYISIGRGLKSSGLPDNQLVSILGADAIPYLEAVNNADAIKAEKDTEDVMELEAAREDYKNRLLSDPAQQLKLQSKGLTVEEAMELWDKHNGYGGK